MTAPTPPPLRFPDPVREDLNEHRPGLAEATEQMLVSHVRPCVAVTAQRVSNAPLRRNSLARLFGAGAAAPVLGVMESKFAGTPYCEAGEQWNEHDFLGQIDLAQATAVLPGDAVRLSGLLRIDLRTDDVWRTLVKPSGLEDALRVRWFPHPSADRAVAAMPRTVGNWETRLDFRLGWTLPSGKALEAIWPLSEPSWYDYDKFYPDGFNADGFDEFHRMLGHKTDGLADHYGFTPPPGCSSDLASYECLLRLTFDNVAGFAWGSNWIYLLAPTEDVRRADLSRVVVTAANS